jgi:hypothetical protein
MAAQLRDVLKLFQHMHPGMTGVSLFDQSSNHRAFAKNARVAKNMNMNPHEVQDDIKVKDGYYTELGIDGTSATRNQSFYVERDYDYPQVQKVHLVTSKRSKRSRKLTNLLERRI